ncbi:kinase-like domain-containing protein [Rhizophagus irregularis DAOM 181602=DAOM 197198]|nr:kinase-like domain-containing protein [Rhizophagus irregularis DAOM 181602=DAOM 197198]
MDLITTNSRYSFDPTPKLKSSPVPILFIPLNNYANLIDKNTYLDVHIHTENTQCIEHELKNEDCFTQNIQEWCKSCYEILHFNQIFTGYYRNFNTTDNNKRIKCKLCGYKSCTKYNLCPNCYLIYSERIESTLDKNPIPIVYLPWWDNSSICITCERNLEFISDCQKWCSRCFTIYSGCKYCLTTNIFFGFTDQSQCIKCKRVEPISTNGNRNIDVLNSTIENNNEITNYVKRLGKDNNPLKIYNFIKDNLELKSFNRYHNRFENIIKYYGITQDPITEERMIVMQYADGGDLHNYLQKNFINISWKDKLIIILEITSGVECIHKENFIHRDLHTGNMLSVKSKCSINHKWHIGDLGLSQPANDTTSSNNEIYGSGKKKLGPGSAVNSHPGAILTSRLLNSSISELSSISSSSTTPFNTKKKYVTKGLVFDVNDAKGRSLNELFPTKQEYSSKEIEFDINDVQWSPLPKINSTVQNSLNIQHLNVNYSSRLSNSINSSRKRKIAEIEIETQDNDRKLAKTYDNLHPDC